MKLYDIKKNANNFRIHFNSPVVFRDDKPVRNINSLLMSFELNIGNI